MNNDKGSKNEHRFNPASGHREEDVNEEVNQCYGYVYELWQMNAPEWVKQNYPKFVHCEKKPLPHVEYEIISVRQLTPEEYQERVNKWNEKQHSNTAIE